ncbi:hypothetical protein IAU60_004905 [Kwoniella sp. DSM 27419]
MASLLLGTPNTLSAEPGERKKIPKVAVYVAGAALAPQLEPQPEPQLVAARAFNAREEKSLFGGALPEEGETQEPVSGLLGIKALAIATALVWGSAGLGALVVSQVLGVKSMRESLHSAMPGLVQQVNVPGRSVDGFDGEAIEQWVEKLEREDESA